MFNTHFHSYQVFIDTETRTAISMTPKVMTTFLRLGLRAGFKKFRDVETPPGQLPMPPLSGYIEAMARPSRFTAFGFVRNPYWRLYSAWRSKFRDPWHKIEADPTLQYPHSVRKRALPRIRQFADAHGLAGAGHDTLVPFETFVEFVVSERALWPNNHWRGQAKMLQLNHFTNMRILRFETDVVEGVTDIFSRLGFERRWIKYRLNWPQNVSSSFEHTPYDERLAALVFNHFEEDFSRFGYERESWHRA